MTALKPRFLRLTAGLLAVAAAVLPSHRARPSEPAIVAVFEIEDSGARLSTTARDRLAAFLTSKIAGSGLRVIPRAQVHRRLRELKRASYEACYDQSCQIEIGKELAAQKSLSPKILRLGDSCVVTLTLFDLRTATTERAADATGGCGVSDLVQALESAALGLVPGTRRTGAPQDDIVVASFGHMQTVPRAGGQAAVVPLRHTAVRGEVVGTVARVEVEQQFSSSFREPIDAVYAFPLPHRAAIHALTMRIGTRTIRAVIKQRQAARAAYDAARRQGRSAALLEQERPNLFTQSVANLLPGETIAVTLEYVEELVPQGGRYQVVFPLTIGPRYTNAGVTDARRVSPPYEHLGRGLRPGRDVSLSLRLRPGLPIGELRALTHRTQIRRAGADGATVELAADDRIPNRDFVLSYDLRGPAPRAALLAGRADRRGHFLLTVQPERRVDDSALAPRDFTFVLDASGSMEGTPLARAQQAMRLCLRSLRPGDRLRIIRFSDDAEQLDPYELPATPENLARAHRYVDRLYAGGGTEFMPALRLAFRRARDPRRAQVIVLFSDFLTGEEVAIQRTVRANLGDANLFSVGIGDSVNRHLIAAMARLGQGEPFMMLNNQRADAVIERLFATAARPVLTGVTLDWGRLPVRDVTPRALPAVFAERPLVVAGRYDRAARGQLVLRGFRGGEPYEQRVDVALPATDDGDDSGATLGLLWARRRITELMDQHAVADAQQGAIEAEVTQVALEYGLASQFTSFVAVDEAVRNRSGRSQRVVVPALYGGAGGPSGELSTDQFVPGDPEVTIRAPASAEEVTLLLPTGELKPCAKDPATGLWRASFLIPEGTADGIYAIHVLIGLRSGEQLRRVLRYQVDGTAPRVEIRLAPVVAAPGAPVRVIVRPRSLQPGSVPSVAGDIGDPTFAARVEQDVATARALLPSGATLALVRQPDGTFAGSFAAPRQRGRYDVPVVARDAARNKVRQVLSLTVR